MSLRGQGVLLRWAARELLRRPGRNALLGTATTLLTLVVAVPLVLSQALAQGAQTLLESGPALVIRRVDGGGLATVPAADTVERIRAVTGVTAAHARIWGVARAGEQAVTVIGLDPADLELATEPDRGAWEWVVPQRGEVLRRELSAGKAVLGPGLAAAAAAGSMVLQGATELQVEVGAILSSQLSMAVHDVVMLRADQARHLLGIPPGHASDVAVRVFHEQEETAIVGDLAHALPWPAQITRRSEMIRTFTGGISQRGGLVLVFAIPAALALVLLVLAVWRDGWAERRELGLLKALGWTTGEMVRLRGYRALLVGVPAVLLGLSGAHWLVFWPGATWVGKVLLGWQGDAVGLSLPAEGAVLVLFEVGAIVLVPLVVASIMVVVRAAACDPEHLLLHDPR